MNDKTVIISAVLGALLVGFIGSCERPKPPEEVRTVDWYQANAAERAKKLEECKASSKTRDATPNCINASRAENDAKASAKWGTEKNHVRTEPSIPIVP